MKADGASVESRNWRDRDDALAYRAGWMSRELLDNICEKAILALVLGILVFGPLAFGTVETWSFLIVESATGLVLLLWAARLWLAQRLQFLWPPICWAVLAFAAYAVGRYLTADIEYVARQELLRVLTYAVLFLAIINNLHRKEPVQIISFTLVFLAMAISFYALYQFIANSQRVWHVLNGYAHRGSGTYINPNHLAGFLEMILPVGVAYALAGRVKPVTRILLGYASLAIVAGIAVTLSRGGWISTAGSLLILFGILMTQKAYRIPAGSFLVLIIAGCAVLIPKSHLFEKRAQEVYAHGKLDDDARFALWEPAVKLWQENLWWGVGPGHFDFRFRPVRPESVQLQPEHVHNDFLNTVVDWGIAGAAVIGAGLMLLAFGVTRTWGHVRREHNDLGANKHSNKFAFMAGATCGLIAISFHSVVDFNMHIPANAILATTWAALLSSQLRFATDRWWHNSRLWSRALASIILASGMIYLAQQTWRSRSELVWLKRAAKAPRNSPEQARLLNEAFRAEPMNFETAYRAAEAWRHLSQFGAEEYPELEGANYVKLAERAMDWYQRAMKLNRWHGYSCLGYGWCLDWLERKTESLPYFQRAEELDPNGYFTLANVGIHYVEIGDLPAAKLWFERSLRLKPKKNDIAVNYLALLNMRLSQAATNRVGTRPDLPEGSR
jgi:O-antigen ligase